MFDFSDYLKVKCVKKHAVVFNWIQASSAGKNARTGRSPRPEETKTHL